MHDAFLKIYGAFDRFSYRGPGSLRAWMERIAVNVALEWLRNRNKLNITDARRRPGSLPDVPGARPVGGGAYSARRADGVRAANLPDGYRTVFNLYCIEGYSHRDIAQMLGINEKSSSSQLFRARALLARRISGLYGDTLDYETK